MLNKKNKKILSVEPWKISFWERIKKVKNSSTKQKVVYIYEAADTSTFRYRVYNMCQSLELSSTWVGSYFFENELVLLEDYLDQVNLIIFVRVRWSSKTDTFMNVVKKKNSMKTMLIVSAPFY